MKVLYITNGITGTGGLERVLSVKASYLADHYNYDVMILTLNEVYPESFYEFSSKVNFSSIKVIGNPISCVRMYVKGINNCVSEFKPDVISVCDDGLKGFFIPLFIKTKAPIIYERHASIELNANNSLKGKAIRLIMQNRAGSFAKFVVLTESNKEEWKVKNVVAIPNPLSFFPLESAELVNKTAIVVGTHSYNKGYDLLLQSWQKIALSYPDWKLHLYGKVDQNKTYLKLAKKLNIDDSIAFYSPVVNIKEKYLKASIMIMSSRSEGFGMVLIEAMACGLPCVSFDCPSGPRDIISNNEDGIIVQRENVVLLTEAITKLISSPDQRKLMGSAAKQNVKRYLPENIAMQWDQLFKEIIA